MVGRKGRVAHPQLVLGDAGYKWSSRVVVGATCGCENTRAAQKVLVSDYAIVITVGAIEIPCFCCFLGRNSIGGHGFRLDLTRSPRVKAAITRIALVIDRRRLAVRGGGESAIKEALGDANRRPVVLERRHNDRRGAQCRALDRWDDTGHILLGQAGGCQDLLRELLKSVRLGRHVRQGKEADFAENGDSSLDVAEVQRVVEARHLVATHLGDLGHLAEFLGVAPISTI
ncbi:BQ5605_C001g00709 [Microbotryum silenes-dioicae]|uniref:BQ5605_C001g00709 protein n=1 Tax=Microbotryum silenes-dioicae TaxID=796604 RepID=A0A2X0M7F1_9BASI|nr:BQ5605_C001g00709 [Microbotryum silenes-dioicae]